ncbi:cyclic nucleotide-binding domain-containing protein [Roseomonas sp. HJA6]|uniref:Cyclic nucleotide-binding domain-containing protein n=1 Tax=Roseomonas alba TaxID=2846776 RepID=A0ABS7AB38_9PROT|nr:cyclic nucleotide-binding domain-containing protein [Neoroseomonas alba]MBW6399521.1 cyclic nucleotide-binding domain-containing protein [Neoroseomonas alba]
MSVTDAAESDMRDVARRLGTIITCRAGDSIFREGDPARDMYVVLSGLVDISSRGRAIATIGPGDALGLVSLIDGLTRTADAVAATDCELATLDEHGFRRAIAEVPEFVWYVMEGLAQRLRATNAAL